MADFRGFPSVLPGAARGMGCQESSGKLTGFGQERLESGAAAAWAS